MEKTIVTDDNYREVVPQEKWAECLDKLRHVRVKVYLELTWNGTLLEVKPKKGGK